MGLMSSCAMATENKALAKKHEKIERQFPDIRHLQTDDPILNDKDEIIIFDVREAKEHAVSHLKNAVHVDPDIDPQDFIRKYAEKTTGKYVVFYCSVGQRSSRLASKTQTSLKELGAKDSFNLEGGIFNWHNEQRELVTLDKSTTDLVHPYNAYWGRMVNDRKKTAYKPAN